MAKKGCKICLCLTQELDSTGRCPSCALALAAYRNGMSYGKFVASGCRVEVDAKPKEPVVEDKLLVCEFCGKQFVGRKGQRFCGNKCRIEHHRIYAKDRARNIAGTQGERICLVCGNVIPQEIHKNQKTCGEECQTPGINCATAVRKSFGGYPV